METRQQIIFSILFLGTSVLACGDEMMAMDGELADLTRHQTELEADLSLHHQEVLLATEASAVGLLEQPFTRKASDHLGAMEHRTRDMESMCHMGGRQFQAESMHETMGRIRTRLLQHQQRMAGSQDLAAMHSEERSFREGLTTMMGEMRAQQGGLRGTASGYSCRMHGH